MRKASKVIVGLFGALVLALALGLSLWVGGRGGGQLEKKLERAEDGETEKQSCEASCARRRDKMGRALVAVHTDMVPWGCYCASVEELEKLKQMPVWVVRGKRVWADDWTPCPYEVDAQRCDAIGIDPERGTEVCLQYAENEWLEYDVDIIDDPATGEFIAIGVGRGPAIFGIWGVGIWDVHEPLPRKVNFVREGALVEDVSVQDFVLIECLPSGDIVFDLVDSDGKPLQKSWHAMLEKPCPLGDICPLGFSGRHALGRAIVGKDLSVEFTIEGMPPQYRTVRAMKGETTKVVVQIDTRDPTGIEGYVWDADTLRPIPGASVWVSQGADFQKGWKEFEVATDETGHYSFQGVDPGVLDKVSAWAWDFDELKSVVYLGKKIEKGERLRLDFPMKRNGEQVSLDPQVEIVSFYPDGQACDDPSLYSKATKDRIEDALNRAFGVLVGKCPGPGSEHARRVLEWYSDPANSTQEICIRPLRSGEEGAFFWERDYVNKNGDFAAYIILSRALVLGNDDNELATTLFHELIHLGAHEPGQGNHPPRQSPRRNQRLCLRIYMHGR